MLMNEFEHPTPLIEGARGVLADVNPGGQHTRNLIGSEVDDAGADDAYAHPAAAKSRCAQLVQVQDGICFAGDGGSAQRRRSGRRNVCAAQATATCAQRHRRRSDADWGRTAVQQKLHVSPYCAANHVARRGALDGILRPSFRGTPCSGHFRRPHRRSHRTYPAR